MGGKDEQGIYEGEGGKGTTKGRSLPLLERAAFCIPWPWPEDAADPLAHHGEPLVCDHTSQRAFTATLLLHCDATGIERCNAMHEQIRRELVSKFGVELR